MIRIYITTFDDVLPEESLKQSELTLTEAPRCVVDHHAGVAKKVCSHCFEVEPTKWLETLNELVAIAHWNRLPVREVGVDFQLGNTDGKEYYLPSKK